MAVTQTGAMYKSLTFDNKTSRSFGVYITGEAVYNAPKRDVEMITIPGRSGSFALDNGRFENIEVSYPAGIFADTEADFRQAISDFRNFLCSRKGYVRLSDEYNPDEYRMAVYKSGLEVDPAQFRAGEFKITFECKPQRWLTSGETATAVASGGTVTNPTLFEASPLIEFEGYGNMNINGYNLELVVPEYGTLQLAPAAYSNTTPPLPTSVTLENTTDLNNGDAITVPFLRVYSYFWYNPSTTYILTAELTSCTGPEGCSAEVLRTSKTINGVYYIGYRFANRFADPTIFSYGTAETKTMTVVGTATVQNQSNIVTTVTTNMAYDGDNTIALSQSVTYSRLTPDVANSSYAHNIITAYSTKSYTYGTIYCDCDLGEIYRLENGVPISMNHLGSFGSDLPVLSSGSNTITYDNTFTNFKVTPRWWKV